MLKYMTALCCISFCHSIIRLTDFDTLVLIQRSSVTSFFVPQVRHRQANRTSEEFANYLDSHWNIFRDQTWVIHDLWVLDEHANVKTYCPSTYEPDRLNQRFRNSLKNKWPALKLDITEESLWEDKFTKYGSCLTDDTSYYFWQAIDFLNRFDIHSILIEDNLIPDLFYLKNQYISTIYNAVGRNIYVRCFPAPNLRVQYILEVHICYDSNLNLLDCTHEENLSEDSLPCDPNIGIIFPAGPNDEEI